MAKPINVVTKEQAEELVSDGAVLIDVRLSEDYETVHLDGSIKMPFFTLHEMATYIIKDRNTKIILYCSKGKRGDQAYNNLLYLGYKNLYCLGG